MITGINDVKSSKAALDIVRWTHFEFVENRKTLVTCPYRAFKVDQQYTC